MYYSRKTGERVETPPVSGSDEWVVLPQDYHWQTWDFDHQAGEYKLKSSEQLQSEAEAIKKIAVNKVQKHLDSFAQTWGYDDIRSACTYAEEPSVLKFQNEGKLLRQWRSQVWKWVDDNQNSYSTIDEFISNIPSAPVRPVG